MVQYLHKLSHSTSDSINQLNSIHKYNLIFTDLVKRINHIRGDLEKSGNCCLANKDTGEKCYNTRLPNSLYCKDHITNKPYGLPE